MKTRKKKSKYLIYNENTKLLEVKADTKSKFQTFLERKKIYFETVMMLGTLYPTKKPCFIIISWILSTHCVTGFGSNVLYISKLFVSKSYVEKSFSKYDISLNEQRIEDLEKQPAFILDIEADEDKMKYVIKNVGGCLHLLSKSKDIFILS